MNKTKPPATQTDAEREVADLLWKLKRISASLGTAIANHDFCDAHAEAGRLADVIDIYEKTHPRQTP